MQFWIILSPLLLGIALVGYAIWQLVKEIKPTLKQVKNLQNELESAKQMMEAYVPEVQSLVSNAAAEAENGRALVLESKEAYSNVKAIVAVLRAFDTGPVREGIAYVRYKRDERRVRKLPEKARSIAGKAREYAEKILQKARDAV